MGTHHPPHEGESEAAAGRLRREEVFERAIELTSIHPRPAIDDAGDDLGLRHRRGYDLRRTFISLARAHGPRARTS
jgi:hypothetical protein